LRRIARSKDLPGRKERIERGWKAGVDSHLHEDLDDLLARAADVQRGFDVYLQLRLRVAERSQRCDRGNLTRFQIKSRPAVDIAEREFDQVPCEVRCNRRQRFDDALAGLAVDFFELV